MATPPAPASAFPRPPSGRLWPKLLFGLACLGTLALVFGTLAQRRGGTSGDGASAAPAAAERAAVAKLVPPPVPDDQNFAMTPFLATLLDRSIASTNDWPEDFSRANNAVQNPSVENSPDGRRTGRLITDLTAWKEAFNEAGRTRRPTRVDAREVVDASANALAAVDVLAALRPFEPVLEELRGASRRPFSRFNIRYDQPNPWAILLPHLAVVKRTCQLLRLKTSAELAAGHSEQGFQDAMLMLRLGGSVRNEPILLSQLTRLACFNITLQCLWEGLAGRRWSETQLQALQGGLEQLDFVGDLDRMLEAERAWGVLTIALARDRAWPNLLGTLLDEEQQAQPWVREAQRAFVQCPRDWFTQEQKNYSRLFDEQLRPGFDARPRRVFPRLVDENARRVEETLQDTSRLLNEHLVFAKLLATTPRPRVHLRFAQAQGMADLAVTACALERHRLGQQQHPASLSALSPRYLKVVPHDLVSGGPLHYEATARGGFVLYSVGWNETDEQGTPAFIDSGSALDPKAGDWVWCYPAN